MTAGLFMLIYGSGVIATLLLSARVGVWLESRLLARYPVMQRGWLRFLAWMAATVGLATAMISLGQLDGVVLKVIAAILATAVFLAGCFLSVRGFTRGWSAFALPAVLLAFMWAGSLGQYISYEQGWQENYGEMGNGAAFLGAVIFTPFVLLLGIPAGLIAGRDTPGRAPA